MHRTFDLAAALVLAVVAAPLMVATGAVLLILEGRPIDYSQVRVGRHRRPFRLFKFRTMRTDAEADGRARWACERGPRFGYRKKKNASRHSIS